MKPAVMSGWGFVLVATTAVAQDGNNSCPVDGCEVRIVSVQKENSELRVTFDANFTPNMSKNHFHVWWGELYDVRQITSNSETTFGMEQGVWHPTDAYPSYLTTGVVSVEERYGATTLCVTAVDRNREILDPEQYDCANVGDLLQ